MNGTSRSGPNNNDFDRLETEFFVGLKESIRRRTRRHRWIAGGVALAIAVGAGTAWVVLANQQMRDRAAYCYAAADQNSRFATVAATDETTPAGAADECAGLWQIGYFDSTSPPSGDGAEHDVPTLNVCLRQDGVMAVFPMPAGEDGRRFCERLGLNTSPRLGSGNPDE